jgi:hypothetical protein
VDHITEPHQNHSVEAYLDTPIKEAIAEDVVAERSAQRSRT